MQAMRRLLVGLLLLVSLSASAEPPEIGSLKNARVAIPRAAKRAPLVFFAGQLGPEAMAGLVTNQTGPLRAGAMGSAMPDMARPFDAMPDQHTGWTLGFLTNPETGPNGRAPGSLAWAGIFNSYYWIDPASGVGGVFLSQLSPFGDAGALAAFAALEQMAYS